MSKGSLGGSTDYNHQSFEDMISDLESERRNTSLFLEKIKRDVEKANENSYWDNKVPFDFKNIVAYSIKHYNTAISEFDDITKDIRYEVESHHVNRLKRIAEVARDININIGKIWHQEYLNKEYGNSEFSIVEHVYFDTRNMAVNLLDVSNIAYRLQDFVGKKHIKMKKNNPWISGSFYLFVAVVVIAGLAVISKTVSWLVLPIILIGGILVIALIGILQLRNDDQITDKTFFSLLVETYKRLPLLKKSDSKK